MRFGSLCARLLPLLGGLVEATLVKHESSVFVPDHVLRVNTKNISIACETRLSAVVNGTSPGPTIRLTPGSTSWIRVYNDMADANLTMHWHGITQSMADFADGTPQAAQWPIPPGHFFDYEVRPSANDSGTYFYHSHVGVQAITVQGALIVEDCGAVPDAYKYDEERILAFADFMRNTDAVMEADLEGVPLNFGGETAGVLLNGEGMAVGHNVSDTCRLAAIDVEPGKTYRLRMIGGTGLSYLTMALQGHMDRMSIIQVDGGPWTQPATFDYIQLASGQRYDVLLRTKSLDEIRKDNQSGVYFLQMESRDRAAQYRGYAYLRYQNCRPSKKMSNPLPPSSPPFTITNATYNWIDDLSLHPLHVDASDFPTAAEVTRRIILQIHQYTNPTTGQVQYHFGNQTWTEGSRTTPLLVDLYKNGASAMPDYETAMANGGWDPNTGSFPVRVGEVLELVLQNTGSGVKSSGSLDAHPFHLHGQHFYDLGAGNGTYDAEANEARMAASNYHPILRDTSVVPRYAEKTTAGEAFGWRAWRIRADGPGVWMLHCHTLEHMVMGLQSVWVVGNATELLKIPLQESTGYLTYGGDVYGNDTYSPVMAHQFSEEAAVCSS